jgi:hypothetical protein
MKLNALIKRALAVEAEVPRVGLLDHRAYQESKANQDLLVLLANRENQDLRESQA